MDEYIERETAIADLELYEKTVCKSEYALAIAGCRSHIRAIPAADVVPVRHGRWIETTQPMGWDDVTCAECSECGEDFVLDEWGMEDMKNLMHYCPNCGAKMDGEA